MDSIVGKWRCTVAHALAGAIAMLSLGAALTGNLTLNVMGELGAGAKNQAQVIAPDGKTIATLTAGQTIALPPGTYKVKLPLIGGEITKNEVQIEAGRTHTLLVQNAAVLQVSIKDREGKEPGFGVTVSQSDPPHAKITSFLSGDKVLFAPAMVDVKVDAPPQGYEWHQVKLIPGQRARLTMDEVRPAELLVQPVWSGLAMDKSTKVIIYHTGTQSQVAASPPASEHRIQLDPGDYDVYVENSSGKGSPYATLSGIHLDPGARVERQVSLDNGSTNAK